MYERKNKAKSPFFIKYHNYLNKTVHAGEAYGPESIAQAVKYLHAERIGHGYHIFSKDKVSGDVVPFGRISEYPHS